MTLAFHVKFVWNEPPGPSYVTPSVADGWPTIARYYCSVLDDTVKSRCYGTRLSMEAYCNWSKRQREWLYMYVSKPYMSKLLAPERCWSVISKHPLLMTFMNTSCEIALRWMPQSTVDDWLRSVSPYDVTRPQWVNTQTLVYNSLVNVISYDI